MQEAVMQIPCPKCGATNWLENETKCHLCGAVLRRCIDCANFDREKLWCRVLQFDVMMRTATNPSLLASSVSCRSYVNNGQPVAPAQMKA